MLQGQGQGCEKREGASLCWATTAKCGALAGWDEAPWASGGRVDREGMVMGEGAGKARLEVGWSGR